MDHWTNPRGKMPAGCAVVIVVTFLAVVVGVVAAAGKVLGW